MINLTVQIKQVGGSTKRNRESRLDALNCSRCLSKLRANFGWQYGIQSMIPASTKCISLPAVSCITDPSVASPSHHSIPTTDFVVSTFTAALCWQAAKDRDSQLSSGVNTSLVVVSGLTTEPPTPARLEYAAALTPAGGTDRGNASPLPWGLRWLQLILWNIACIASLLVTLVWATPDVSYTYEC